MADNKLVISITRTNAGTVTIRDIEPGSTIAEILSQAGIDLGTYGVALNGARASADTQVHSSGMISLVGAVKGGAQ